MNKLTFKKRFENYIVYYDNGYRLGQIVLNQEKYKYVPDDIEYHSLQELQEIVKFMEKIK